MPVLMTVIGAILYYYFYNFKSFNYLLDICLSPQQDQKPPVVFDGLFISTPLPSLSTTQSSSNLIGSFKKFQ